MEASLHFSEDIMYDFGLQKGDYFKDDAYYLSPNRTTMIYYYGVKNIYHEFTVDSLKL